MIPSYGRVPYELSRDSVLWSGEQLRCNPALRFKAPKWEKLGAAADFRHGPMNQAAQVYTPIKLPTWDHSPQPQRPTRTDAREGLYGYRPGAGRSGFRYK